MGKELLVAKRSCKQRLQSIIVNPRRINIAIRNSQRARITRKKQTKRSKFQNERKHISVTPARRLERFAAEAKEESDDTLVLSEPFDDIEIGNDRGRLLQLSTHKPTTAQAKINQEPDPLPSTFTDNTRRIVRVVKLPPKSGGVTSLGIQVVPRTVEIGIQVGTPSPEVAKDYRYHFHAVQQQLAHQQHLAHQQQQQLVQQQQLIQQQQQQLSQKQQQWAQWQPNRPAVLERPYVIPYIAPTAPAPSNRRQRRNAIAREKYIQRHNLKRE